MEILRLIAGGYKDEEIAGILGLSIYSVRTHGHRVVMRVCGTRPNRAHAVHIAHQKGWLS